jgi:formamidopyrimidine-DNA glycosylase
MPELPEVETVRRSLERLIAGQTVATVKVHEPRLRRPLAPDFATTLVGRAIRGVGRRGKYLYLRLDDGRVWVVHLGMTGRLIVGSANEGPQPHDHVVIALSDGRCLRYNDIRRFGLMAIGREHEIAALIELGVEPLSPEFTPRYLWLKTRATQRAVKDVLMDQRVVAGIGNIYANELLFRARIRPARSAATLSQQAVTAVVKATKSVLREAIRHHGSSISDYLDGEGKPGTFQDRFRVYNRAGEPCYACATPIQREIRGGRSAFFCPTCQR